MSETVWVVGQYRSGESGGTVWEIQGVFSTRDKALAACRNENYFIGPLELDAELPDEGFTWPGVEYPVTA